MNSSLRLGQPSDLCVLAAHRCRRLTDPIRRLSLPPSLHIIFPEITDQPTALRPITPAEYLLIATPHPANEPLYADVRTAIFLPIIERETFILLRLSYHATPSRIPELELAWALLESSQAAIDSWIREVVGEGLSPGKAFNARESDFIWWAIVFDSSIMDMYAVCDYVVQHTQGLREEAKAALVAESDSRLSHARVLLARHAEVMMVILSCWSR